jgi:hypothetical protein
MQSTNLDAEQLINRYPIKTILNEIDEKNKKIQQINRVINELHSKQIYLHE